MDIKQQACFQTPDDEPELVPIWEIARKDRETDLVRRKEAGENVDGDIATDRFFDGIGEFVRKTQLF